MKIKHAWAGTSQHWMLEYTVHRKIYTTKFMVVESGVCSHVKIHGKKIRIRDAREANFE